MKKTPHALTRLFTLLLASLTILSISVAAAGTAGSSSDPLVTLSYLNEKFLPELMTRVDEKLAARTDTASKELRAQVDADIKRLEEKYGSQTSNEGASVGTVDSFAVVTMTNGQVLYGAIGCEVMLRVGTASVVSPSSPGLIDSTGGTTLDNGAGLTKNHLYMMTISDRGVKATAATTKLLVRGTYEVNRNKQGCLCIECTGSFFVGRREHGRSGGLAARRAGALSERPLGADLFPRPAARERRTVGACPAVFARAALAAPGAVLLRARGGDRRRTPHHLRL